jgi:hypothetical protein
VTAQNGNLGYDIFSLRCFATLARSIGRVRKNPRAHEADQVNVTAPPTGADRRVQTAGRQIAGWQIVLPGLPGSP